MGFTLQGLGPFLQWMTLAVLCILTVGIAVALYKLGGLPGAIAAARGHPQATAINVCGWMGLVTLVLWPVAMVWAHLDRSPLPEGGAFAPRSQSVAGRLQQASLRLAAIESILANTTVAPGS